MHIEATGHQASGPRRVRQPSDRLYSRSQVAVDELISPRAAESTWRTVVYKIVRAALLQESQFVEIKQIGPISIIKVEVVYVIIIAWAQRIP
jgi:hypothetical protein